MAKKDHSFFAYYLQTFRDIVKNSSIFSTLILAIFLYSFFYPTAYESQKSGPLPIVIVDEEQSALSNQLIDAVQRSAEVNTIYSTTDFLEAKQWVQEQKADGILLIPHNMSASLLRGENSGIGLYLSSAYFLKTKQVGLGIISALESQLAQFLAQYSLGNGFKLSLPIHQIPLYNTLSGYGSYVFPAVAPLIVHQTVLLGLAMLIAGYREKKWFCSCSELMAIFLAILTIGCLSCYYLFGFTFWLYDYPHGGNFWGMLIAVPIYIGCITTVSLLFASFLDTAERAGHVLVVTSIPMFLLTGMAWPHQAMPQWLQWFAWCLPSTNGVQTFVQLNQMGVPIADVANKLIYLFILMLICFLLAYLRLRQPRK